MFSIGITSTMCQANYRRCTNVMCKDLENVTYRVRQISIHLEFLANFLGTPLKNVTFTYDDDRLLLRLQMFAKCTNLSYHHEFQCSLVSAANLIILS